MHHQDHTAQHLDILSRLIAAANARDTPEERAELLALVARVAEAMATEMDAARRRRAFYIVPGIVIPAALLGLLARVREHGAAVAATTAAAMAVAVGALLLLDLHQPDHRPRGAVPAPTVTRSAGPSRRPPHSPSPPPSQKRSASPSASMSPTLSAPPAATPDGASSAVPSPGESGSAGGALPGGGGSTSGAPSSPPPTSSSPTPPGGGESTPPGSGGDRGLCVRLNLPPLLRLGVCLGGAQ